MKRKKYRTGLYILSGQQPIAAINALAWGQWYETADRRVSEDFIEDIRISTVFLGIDHNHFGKGPPILFETMIFGGELDGYQDRCSTWAEALAMHQRAVVSVAMTVQKADNG